MGTAADYTLIVLVVALGVAVWTLLDRLAAMQRDIDSLKQKLGVSDPPEV